MNPNSITNIFILLCYNSITLLLRHFFNTDNTNSVDRRISMTNLLGDGIYAMQYSGINSKTSATAMTELSDTSIELTTPKATTPIPMDSNDVVSATSLAHYDRHIGKLKNKKIENVATAL